MSNLELGILIIPSCCKEMVCQYVVVAKMKYTIAADHGYRTGAFIIVVRCLNHYAIDDHDVCRVKLIQFNLKKKKKKKKKHNSSNGGGQFFLKRKCRKRIFYRY
jgi:hypothetical protein